MSDPAGALRPWCDLLTADGTLVLVEGSWPTGAGPTATRTAEFVGCLRDQVEVRHLPDPALWTRDHRPALPRPHLHVRSDT